MKIHLLIIDDEPRWIEFVRSNLSKFQIVVASTVEEVKSALEEKDFDLVIASSRYLEVLNVIAKDHPKQLAVATIQPTTAEAKAAYTQGASRYFIKSFDPNDLLESIGVPVAILGAENGEARKEP